MKHIHLRIIELLAEKEISKNQICKDLDLPRGNFNRYCRDDFQKIDANLLLKLCIYFDCDISKLLEINNKLYECSNKSTSALFLFYPL